MIKYQLKKNSSIILIPKVKIDDASEFQMDHERVFGKRSTKEIS